MRVYNLQSDQEFGGDRRRCKSTIGRGVSVMQVEASRVPVFFRRGGSNILCDTMR